ncbi:hypothetical protein RN001_004716 [Aquatica leii]|uniref:Uncharacterized protein n=1 Tax=Aquatica leii TaxID=1421715 RepID=A0AAN7PB36_9COLE|nr:hypothetical protein RN001_004716 [Aquatica leii]
MTSLQLPMTKKKRSPESLQLNSTYAKYTTLSVEGAKASEPSNLSRSEQINSSSASEVTDNSHSPRSESEVADVVLEKNTLDCLQPILKTLEKIQSYFDKRRI